MRKSENEFQIIYSINYEKMGLKYPNTKHQEWNGDNNYINITTDYEIQNITILFHVWQTWAIF